MSGATIMFVIALPVLTTDIGASMTTPTCHCGQPETADHTSDAHFLRGMATAYPKDSTWSARLKRIADLLDSTLPDSASRVVVRIADALDNQRQAARLLHQPATNYGPGQHCGTCKVTWPRETSTALGWTADVSPSCQFHGFFVDDALCTCVQAICGWPQEHAAHDWTDNGGGSCPGRTVALPWATVHDEVES